jgi:ABC-type branched-subunit amino acid transport system substrate-binding protein
MRIRPKHRAVAGIAALALVLAACGGDDDTGAEPETDDTEDVDTDDDADADADVDTDDDADADADADAGDEGAGADGVLTVGTLLPETGSLAFLGPPEFAGAELAALEVNEAGGVLGEDLVLIQGDSGDTSTDIASQTVERLLGQNADAIVGAASSAVSFTVIDRIVGANVIQFSPANTAAAFTDYDDNGLYFRTAPSDILQGQVLGNLMLDDGNATIGIMALQDPYGEGLAATVTETVEGAGGEVVASIIYDPQAQNFDAEIQQLVDADPDGIAVIGFDETSRILTSLFAAGIGADNKNIYGSDGNMGNALGENFDDNPEVISGMAGTTPLAELSSDFTDRLLEVDPDLVDFSYSAETYDAVIVIALAALVAGTDDPVAVAAEIPGVTREPGTECTSFAECKDLIESGEEINYDGVSGPIAMTDEGDPSEASFAIQVFQDDARIETREFVIAALGF